MTTNNAVNTTLSGQTGTGTFVGDTSPGLTTPTIGDASATSVTFSSTTGIVGSTTNDSAAAGSVGQYISSLIASGSAVSLSTTVAANVTSISLTAGDWDVWGNVAVTSSGTTLLNAYGWISLSSATPPDISLVSGNFVSPAVTAQWASSVPGFRISIASTTTVYLGALSQFAVGTATACGGIYARRIR